KSSNGWSSGPVSITNSGSGTFSPGIPTNSTDYALTCTRDSYTCTWSRDSYHLDWYNVYETSTKSYVSTSTCDYIGTVTYQSPSVTKSSQTSNNTLVVVNPPTITSFYPGNSNILINKSTNLLWNYTSPDTNSPTVTVPTQQFCYTGGVQGDPTGWSLYPSVSNKVTSGNNTLSPQKTTTYGLICRNYYQNNSSCYSNTGASSTIKVYGTSINETNPSALLEQAWTNFVRGWRW
ncbi:MAG: hypothetical protein KGJ01_03255, partial [Patescibacteria group bacterium]|nr:hypothetical protein [Patescibacteria group bacterium]